MLAPPLTLHGAIPMINLLSCPFCGGEASIVQIGNEATRKRGFEVRCETWGCATKKAAMVIRHTLDQAREFAIAAWNRRAPTASPANIPSHRLEDQKDLLLKLKETEAKLAEVERERDAWKASAEHHFGHMRAALDLSYALQYPVDPTFLEQIAEEIDCGSRCEHGGTEYDTGSHYCHEENARHPIHPWGCSGYAASELRDFAKALRVQAWTLAFAPPRTARAELLASQARVKALEEVLGKIASFVRMKPGAEPGSYQRGYDIGFNNAGLVASGLARSVLSVPLVEGGEGGSSGANIARTGPVARPDGDPLQVGEEP
jgi:Lar family restriction alleviation protein